MPASSRCSAHTQSGQRCKRMGDMDPVTHTVRCYQHAGVEASSSRPSSPPSPKRSPKRSPKHSPKRSPKRSLKPSTSDLLAQYHHIEPFILRDIHAVMHMDGNRFQKVDIVYKWKLTSYFSIKILIKVGVVRFIFRNKLLSNQVVGKVYDFYEFTVPYKPYLESYKPYSLEELTQRVHAHFSSDGRLPKLFVLPPARVLRELNIPIQSQEGILLHVKAKGKVWPHDIPNVMKHLYRTEPTPKHLATLKALQSRTYPKEVHVKVDSVL